MMPSPSGTGGGVASTVALNSPTVARRLKKETIVKFVEVDWCEKNGLFRMVYFSVA